VGDVALGGLSLRDPPPWGDADREEMTLLVLLLLKTCASPEPSSSIAAIGGGGELGVWRVWDELVVGAVCGEFGLCGVSAGFLSAMEVSRAPAFAAVALVRAFKALARARRLDESITEAAPRQAKEQRVRTHTS